MMGRRRLGAGHKPGRTCGYCQSHCTESFAHIKTFA